MIEKENTHFQQFLDLKQNQFQNHHEDHLAVGALIKSIVYGATDGVINTTIILLTGVSYDTPVSQLFGICFSAIVAGALDMALCDYVSSKSEMQYVALEQKRQEYEIDNFPQIEKKQMFEIYKERGFDDKESARISELLFTSKTVFLNVMMMEELGLVRNDDENLPIKCGIATFFAFLVTSLISFTPYIFSWAIQKKQTHPWAYVLVISSVQLVSLGIAQAKVTGVPVLKPPIQFLFLGVLSTGVGFLLGKTMKNE